MYQNCFRPVLHPGPRWMSLQRSLDFLIGGKEPSGPFPFFSQSSERGPWPRAPKGVKTALWIINLQEKQRYFPLYMRAHRVRPPLCRCLFKGKGNGQTFVMAPLSRQSHRRGAQVHGAHQAASHIHVAYLP